MLLQLPLAHFLFASRTVYLLPENCVVRIPSLLLALFVGFWCMVFESSNAVFVRRALNHFCSSYRYRLTRVFYSRSRQ
jgi:hypothetical protein